MCQLWELATHTILTTPEENYDKNQIAASSGMVLCSEDKVDAEENREEELRCELSPDPKFSVVSSWLVVVWLTLGSFCKHIYNNISSLEKVLVPSSDQCEGDNVESCPQW